MVKGYEQISLSGSTIYTLTIPTGARKAIVQAETANVRMRLDGTNPAAGVGEIIIAAGASRELHDDELAAAKFIAATGSPKLNVHYYGANA
jgi:hypothetical protein